MFIEIILNEFHSYIIKSSFYRGRNKGCKFSKINYFNKNCEGEDL